MGQQGLTFHTKQRRLKFLACECMLYDSCRKSCASFTCSCHVMLLQTASDMTSNSREFTLLLDLPSFKERSPANLLVRMDLQRSWCCPNCSTVELHAEKEFRLRASRTHLMSSHQPFVESLIALRVVTLRLLKSGSSLLHHVQNLEVEILEVAKRNAWQSSLV